MAMKTNDRIRIVAWACLLIGISLIVWQARSGGGSDWLFNVGVAAMITGSVLRVYAKSGGRKRHVDPLDDSAACWAACPAGSRRATIPSGGRISPGPFIRSFACNRVIP